MDRRSLDGTREFVEGLPEFCVSIGYIENGIPVAGGIYNPATRQTFLGAVGGRPWCRVEAGCQHAGEDATEGQSQGSPSVGTVGERTFLKDELLTLVNSEQKFFGVLNALLQAF